MTSAYKAASNRRNSVNSTGPKASTAKERVGLNALKHGLTARTAVLPDEDPEAFARHREGIMAALRPRDDIELQLAHAFVLATWKRNRCDRAEAGLAAHRMQHAESEEATKERHQVAELGRRLFADRRGDSRNYPHGFQQTDSGTRTSAPQNPDEPDDPEHILIDLQSTITGCNWLLARWAELKEKLAPGLSWQSQDKLRAVRLLGKQPLDAPDEPAVWLIYVASNMVDPRCDSPFSELEQEFAPDSPDYVRFVNRLEHRPWPALRPQNDAEARQKLEEIVEKATARIGKILAAHEKRAQLYAGKAASRLVFDASDEGERLRRHQRANARDMFRSLDRFTMHRATQNDFHPFGRNVACIAAQADTDRSGAPMQASLPPVEWGSNRDGLLAEPSSPDSELHDAREQASTASAPRTVDDGPIAETEELKLQNKANAGCNGEAGSAGRAVEPARPEPHTCDAGGPARHEDWRAGDVRSPPAA
jgi:hypothetical protein